MGSDILMYSKKSVDELREGIIEDIEETAFMFGATSGDEIMEHTWAASLLKRVKKRFDVLNREA